MLLSIFIGILFNVYFGLLGSNKFNIVSFFGLVQILILDLQLNIASIWDTVYSIDFTMKRLNKTIHAF